MFYKTYINELSLVNFKIHKKLNLKFDKDLIFIIGENACGKTSILESIYYTGTIKNFLNVEDKKLIHFNKEFSKIKILENKKNKYEIIISENAKFIKKNNIEYKKLSDFINELNVLSFTNSDEDIIYGSPKNRRFFIDYEISRINKNYLSILSKYNKTLKIRNNCLKEDKIDFLYLDVVTNELISLNKKIMEIRRKYIEILNNTLKNNKLFSNEEYSVIYKPNLDEDNIKNLFIKKQNFDILNKITNLGIHKDDFEIIINNIKAEDFASYGQMRSIIINLKIAVLEVIKEYKKILPVLLLDDIFVGLDDNRKNILIQKIKGMQVFITTNSLENIDKKLLENSNIIKLEREE